MTDPAEITVEIGRLLNEARKALAGQEWFSLKTLALVIQSKAKSLEIASERLHDRPSES